jgi:crossover junction endodeoxyribonuclease RusA
MSSEPAASVAEVALVGDGVKIDGRPRPKGSMVCQGGRQHRLVESVKDSTAWKLTMIRAIRAEYGIVPIKDGNRVVGWRDWEPINTPIGVGAVFMFWPENGVTEDKYPIGRVYGDTDKLCRNLGDAMEQSGLIKDDNLIVAWGAEKRWCVEGESPGVIFDVVPRI